MCVQRICTLTVALLGMIETFLEWSFVKRRPEEKGIADSTWMIRALDPLMRYEVLKIPCRTESGAAWLLKWSSVTFDFCTETVLNSNIYTCSGTPLIGYLNEKLYSTWNGYFAVSRHSCSLIISSPPWALWPTVSKLIRAGQSAALTP
jgi:hypothetical protein